MLSLPTKSRLYTTGIRITEEAEEVAVAAEAEVVLKKNQSRLSSTLIS